MRNETRMAGRYVNERLILTEIISGRFSWKYKRIYLRAEKQRREKSKRNTNRSQKMECSGSPWAQQLEFANRSCDVLFTLSKYSWLDRRLPPANRRRLDENISRRRIINRPQAGDDVRPPASSTETGYYVEDKPNWMQKAKNMHGKQWRMDGRRKSRAMKWIGELVRINMKRMTNTVMACDGVCVCVCDREREMQ